MWQICWLSDPLFDFWQQPYSWCSLFFSSIVSKPENSHPHRTEVNNEWSYTFIRPLYVQYRVLTVLPLPTGFVLLLSELLSYTVKPMRLHCRWGLIVIWRDGIIRFNPLAPELFFLILAHPVYKMWIIQEPNKLALWNKLHFEEKKRRV